MVRAAEEVDLAFADKVIHQGRLVHIDIAILANLVKTLYSDRVLHDGFLLQFLANVDKIREILHR